MVNQKLTPGSFEIEAIDSEICFSISEYKDRLTRIRRLMADQNIDLLYVTTPEAVCYLHGYYINWYKANGPRRYPQYYGTAVHVDHDHLIHFDNPTEAPVLAKLSISSDNRYFPSREGNAALDFVISELKSEGWLNGTVGLEYWSYIPNRAVSELTEAAFHNAGCDVIDGSGVTREARRIKSEKEIYYMEEATRLADVGLDTVQKTLRAGISELELFGEVTSAMMKAGSEFPALIPIFSSLPIINNVLQMTGHSMATHRIIREGEILVADLCGVVNRYHGNVNRGFYVGDNPPKQIVDLYDKAGGAYAIVENNTRAGMSVGEFSEIMIDFYKSINVWGKPGWSIGYELGLSLPPDWVGEFYFDVNDDPAYMNRIFDEGMVTNFEVLFNTTFVDMLVFEKEKTRVLSKSPRELIIVS